MRFQLIVARTEFSPSKLAFQNLNLAHHIGVEIGNSRMETQSTTIRIRSGVERWYVWTQSPQRLASKF